MLTKPGMMEKKWWTDHLPTMHSQDHKECPFFPGSKRVPFPSASGTEDGMEQHWSIGHIHTAPGSAYLWLLQKLTCPWPKPRHFCLIFYV